MSTHKPQTEQIAIIGLGYVGMPLAAAFSPLFDVIGFDVDESRIDELRNGHDRTRELTAQQMAALKGTGIRFSCERKDLETCDFFIIAVPTPVDQAHRPDMSLLKKASQLVGAVMKQGAIVIYESTVYPGATQEVCVPILEQASGMTFNTDFYCGYSPERINPGDKEHTLSKITKITSGSTPQIAERVDALYGHIIEAGTHKASSLRVAEAAKVIENIQRDVNIALINELAIIFNRLGISTREVLEAAGTKWNFINFRPGLVGGHCIGVDPYYLTHKAQEIGYHPEMILAGRRINDGMADYVAHEVVKLMLSHKIPVLESKILVLGLTFKENCPDLRNTKVATMIDALSGYHAHVDVYDPWIDRDEARHEYGLDGLAEFPDQGDYDCIILAVPHSAFVERGLEGLRAAGKPGAVFYDLKAVFSQEMTSGAL